MAFHAGYIDGLLLGLLRFAGTGVVQGLSVAVVQGVEFTLFSVTPSHARPRLRHYPSVWCIGELESACALVGRGCPVACLRVDTFAVRLFTSHLRHLRTAQVAMSGGEADSSWAQYFLSHMSYPGAASGSGSGSGEHAGAT